MKRLLVTAALLITLLCWAADQCKARGIVKADGFTFRMAGSAADDPGLRFGKSK